MNDIELGEFYKDELNAFLLANNPNLDCPKLNSSQSLYLKVFNNYAKQIAGLIYMSDENNLRYLRQSHDEFPRDALQFIQSIEELYTLSISDSFYWQFCPFKVYQKTFNNRLRLFEKKNYPDGDLESFIENEKEKLSLGLHFIYNYVGIDKRYKYIPLDKISIAVPEIIEKIKLTQKKKLNFLEGLLKKNNDKDLIDDLSKKDIRNSAELKYEDIYRDRKMISKVEDILKRESIIDESGLLIADKGDLVKYFLVLYEPEFNTIAFKKPINRKEVLAKVFCNRFGLNVYRSGKDNLPEEPRVSTSVITLRKYKGVDLDEIANHFL